MPSLRRSFLQRGKEASRSFEHWTMSAVSLWKGMVAFLSARLKIVEPREHWNQFAFAGILSESSSETVPIPLLPILSGIPEIKLRLWWSSRNGKGWGESWYLIHSSRSEDQSENMYIILCTYIVMIHNAYTQEGSMLCLWLCLRHLTSSHLAISNPWEDLGESWAIPASRRDEKNLALAGRTFCTKPSELGRFHGPHAEASNLDEYRNSSTPKACSQMVQTWHYSAFGALRAAMISLNLTFHSTSWQSHTHLIKHEGIAGTAFYIIGQA